MDIKLFFIAILKFLIGVGLIGTLLFFSAGTFDYYNGWLFMGLLFIPMIIIGVFLMIKNPELLRKRLYSREKDTLQKNLIFFSGLLFFFGFISAGFDYRNNITSFPAYVTIIASIIFVISYIFYFEVLRENIFLSRTIEVQKNQHLINSGLYSIVRHPMYSTTLVQFLSIPFILGSFISFVIFLIYPIILIKRITNEENFLEKNLHGYTEYKKQVKYKLIPFIW